MMILYRNSVVVALAAVVGLTLPARNLLLVLGVLLTGSLGAAERFETLFSWGAVKDEACARAYAEIGVTDVFARGAEGFAAAKKYGMRAYCSFFPCGRNAQGVTAEERKYLDYINAEDLRQQNVPADERGKAKARRLAESKCQFGGLEANPESALPLKTPERLEAELKIVLANGGTRLAVCNGDDMLKPGYAEIFRKYAKGERMP